ncbi:helix-turn-helix domain-containing protein [Kitasatospora sp. NPDC085464]|uniref:helix-turn-helix domain-containing protein n=1 Tax=Kitasatospora sp. NPDC085464 TaxID=3364063 RepID=UPI0037CA9BB4
MVYLLGVEDLAVTRCGYSPLHETVCSLRLRGRPGGFPEQRGWAASWARDYAGLDTELLDALVTPRGFAPDVLTPRPRGCRPCIQDELPLLAAVPPDRLPAGFRTAYACDGSPLPPVLDLLLDDPYALRVRLVSALGEYWTRCLEPAWWPRARTVLEADLAYRGRRLAECGPVGLFADLDPGVSWADGALRIRGGARGAPAPARREPVAGRGLVLMPTLFADRALCEAASGGAPVVVYPARGRGTMAEGTEGVEGPDTGAAAASAALADLIGVPRARVLGLLDTPTTTTALAQRLGVTLGAVSRHLGALAAAGLLERTRSGRAVLYRLSPLGESLAAGPSRSGPAP